MHFQLAITKSWEAQFLPKSCRHFIVDLLMPHKFACVNSRALHLVPMGAHLVDGWVDPMGTHGHQMQGLGK